MSEVTQEHLQNLISQGCMTVTKLAICRVPKDPTSPAPAGGIRRVMGGILRAGIWSVVTSISLVATIVLWLGDASIDSFATLCEAYMGIEPHFDLWNYFFCTRLWGSVDILVRSGPGVDPYFCFSMSDPLVGWHRSLCSWVAALFLNPNGGTVWLSNTSAGYNPCAMSSGGWYDVG
jgi:hypothetical protein